MKKDVPIRYFLLAAATMTAFAANSILNRLALAESEIGPVTFSSIRVASGVLVLAVLLALRDRQLPRPGRPQPTAVAGLTVYMVGFSLAYVSMDAGIGALVLFGTVQLTMFAGSLIGGQTPHLRRWIGMGLALLGLAILSMPAGPVSLPLNALALMGAAGIGWGLYSLVGIRAIDPLKATGSNFVYCLPLVLLALYLWPDTVSATPVGIMLAVLAGGVTSALGYALWYSLLPSLDATAAALAQLSVPPIALALGAVLLSEPVTSVAVLSATLILGGIAFGLKSKP